MRKLAIFLVAVSAVVVFTAMRRPPVEQLVEGQAKCGNDICMGSPNVKTHVKGPISLENTAGATAFTPNPDGGLTTLVTANNYLNSTTKALINWDFPALASVAGSFQQSDTPTVTIANCPFGSQLLVGVDQPVTAGLTPTPLLSAANTVFVRMTLGVLDAGAPNMPDASYLVRCFP